MLSRNGDVASLCSVLRTKVDIKTCFKQCYFICLKYYNKIGLKETMIYFINTQGGGQLSFEATATSRRTSI